jgi:protein SCO1
VFPLVETAVPFPHRSRSGWVVMARVVMLLASLALALVACGTGNSAHPAIHVLNAPKTPKGLRGVVQSPGLPKPNLTLVDTAGHPYNLTAQTQGKVTLLYFGYTHCPDVCPTHMANIATALHQLPASVTSQVTVVFVTTDPQRDTTTLLRAWLDHFDRSFIGLTGTVDQIQAAEAAAGLPPSTPDSSHPLPGGGYSVEHAAQVELFTTDNLTHVEYPSGYSASDWTNDLPILVRGWPA